MPRPRKLPAILEEFKEVPGGAVTVDAADFLVGLAKEGLLPGFAKGEHGTVQAGNFEPAQDLPASALSQTNQVLRCVHFSKDGDDSDYFYLVARASNGAPWKVTKAWRAAPDGRVLERFPVDH